MWEPTLEDELNVEFAQRVSQLSEARKLDLVTLTIRERRNRYDPWVLDEIDARRWLCELLVDPSPGVSRAYERMKEDLERLWEDQGTDGA